MSRIPIAVALVFLGCSLMLIAACPPGQQYEPRPAPPIAPTAVEQPAAEVAPLPSDAGPVDPIEPIDAETVNQPGDAEGAPPPGEGPQHHR